MDLRWLSDFKSTLRLKSRVNGSYTYEVHLQAVDQSINALAENLLLHLLKKVYKN